jgi:hypothetical protein
VCNTHTRKHPDHRLELVAQAAIPAGEQVLAVLARPDSSLPQVWTRYTTPQIGSYQRVADIQKTWFLKLKPTVNLLSTYCQTNCQTYCQTYFQPTVKPTFNLFSTYCKT